MTWRVKDWAKFQHFKDRSPPWVKLYRDILDDPDWHDLDAEHAKCLVMLWLIASEDKDMEGKLPDVRRLSFRLRMSEAKLKQALIKLSHWLEHDDIDLISDGYHDDAPEKRRDRERDRGRGKDRTPLERPDDVSEQVWDDFLVQRKKLKADLTQTALDGIRREADKARWTLEQALIECTVRGWRGFKAEWIENKTKGYANVDKRDGAIKALDRSLGLGEFAGSPGQYRDETVDDVLGLPAPGPRTLS